MNSPAPTFHPGYTLWIALALTLSGAAAVFFAVLPGGMLLAGGVSLLAICAWRGSRRLALLSKMLAEAEAGREPLGEVPADASERYRQVLDHANDAMFFVDPHDGTLLEVNRRAEEMLGYTCEEIRHLSLGVLFPGRQHRRYLKMVRQILRDGSAEETQLLLQRQDGSLLYGDIQARLGWLGKQRVVHGSIRDVTPNMHLITELRRHNQHLDLLNQVALRLTDGRTLSSILATIQEQVISSLDVSGGGIFLLRHRNSEMDLAFHQGMPADVITELAALRPGEGLAGHVASSCRPRLSLDLVNDRRRVCASVIADNWKSFLAVPLVADDSCLGVFFVFSRGQRELNRNDLGLLQAIGRQIGPLVKKTELFDELQWQQRLNQASLRELERSRTALRNNLEQLEQQHRMLQNLDRMKSTFLSLASHELRTPLTIISTGAELLQERTGGILDASGQCALEAILQGSRRLRDVIEDLLEAARLEANEVYLAREDFDPRTVLEEVVAAFQPLCNLRQLTCSVGDIPAQAAMRGDVYHLRRALGRLLENAVKFTPEGGWIRVEAALRSAVEIDAAAERLRRFSPGFFDGPRGTDYLEIRVRDNGMGLDPGEEEQVFQLFYTGGDIASHSTSRERFGGKGVGLGLTLARGLIAAHDGILWAESAGRGSGSSFCMLLPLADRGGAVGND